jgi:hypothetical protein
LINIFSSQDTFVPIWLSVRFREGEQHAIQRARPYVESRSCGRGFDYRAIIEGEQQAIGRAAIPYMESRICRKRT